MPAHFEDALVINEGEVTLASIADSAAEKRVEIEAVLSQEAKSFTLVS